MELREYYNMSYNTHIIRLQRVIQVVFNRLAVSCTSIECPACPPTETKKFTYVFEYKIINYTVKIFAYIKIDQVINNYIFE